MAEDGRRIDVRILAVRPIIDYRGPVLIAGARPKFVVAMILEGEEITDGDDKSGVSLPIERVVIFAIDSVVRLFLEKEVTGERFALRVRTTVSKEGNRIFLLDLA